MLRVLPHNSAATATAPAAATAAARRAADLVIHSLRSPRHSGSTGLARLDRGGRPCEPEGMLLGVTSRRPSVPAPPWAGLQLSRYGTGTNHGALNSEPSSTKRLSELIEDATRQSEW
ncbi:hypothetical protein DFH94DRAFT_681274 [Russula ochroleuca]|uniref:Uncharacterized protein n=1 Tax=Russula ochroleuca TaxID=152965 RepID=A0A9P5MYM0_9AGAM|nr:hypothetical protein DFH94DRAFT_681274 [Russula ochroleuca]